MRAILWPISALYAGAWAIYRGLYRIGIKRAAEPHLPIVCIGNLTVGGTGKTPTVACVARTLQELGYRVVIGCSGYGSPRSVAATVAPSGPLSPREWGDEPAELRALLPGVPIIVGRARVRAAELCASHFPDSVLLMDDGFQHLPLRLHVTVLIEPAGPVSRLCLPAGPYREPRRHQRLADLVLPSDRFELHFSGLQFSEPILGPVNVLCAIGRPDRFRLALEEAGVQIKHFVALPDHDELSRSGLFASDPEGVWVVTAKDHVKLNEGNAASAIRLIAAFRSVTIEPQPRFRKWLKERIEQAKPTLKP